VEPAPKGVGVVLHFSRLAVKGGDRLMHRGEVIPIDIRGEFEPELAADDFRTQGLGHVPNFSLFPAEMLAEFAAGSDSVMPGGKGVTGSARSSSWEVMR